MARDLVPKNVTLAADVKTAIAADVATQGVSANDIVVGLLAEHFRVRFEGTGRRSRGIEKLDEGAVLLHVPAALASKLDAAKSKQPAGRRTLQGVVEAVLRPHYELEALAA